MEGISDRLTLFQKIAKNDNKSFSVIVFCGGDRLNPAIRDELGDRYLNLNTSFISSIRISRSHRLSDRIALAIATNKFGSS